MTQYIVLWRSHEQTTDPMLSPEWREITAIMARSARSAISQVVQAEGGSYNEGTFLAIPARSFRPVTVKVETKTAIKFS